MKYGIVLAGQKISEQIAQAFRKMDFKAMTEAVPDELVDAIAIAGTPDDVRDQLKQWDGIADHVLFYPPTVGVAPERAIENMTAIIEAFGS